MARLKNQQWSIATDSKGDITVIESAILAVLMDLRDEMQALNRLLHCPNFVDIPHKLERIVRKRTTCQVCRRGAAANGCGSPRRKRGRA